MTLDKISFFCYIDLFIFAEAYALVGMFTNTNCPKKAKNRS
jgi:hypothetical protein